MDLRLARKNKKKTFSKPTEKNLTRWTIDMKNKRQEKYSKTDKGKGTIKSAGEAYDKRDLERRRKQKRDYMRRKREVDRYAWRYGKEGTS